MCVLPTAFLFSFEIEIALFSFSVAFLLALILFLIFTYAWKCAKSRVPAERQRPIKRFKGRRKGLDCEKNEVWGLCQPHAHFEPIHMPSRPRATNKDLGTCSFREDSCGGSRSSCCWIFAVFLKRRTALVHPWWSSDFSWFVVLQFCTVLSLLCTFLL